MTTRLQDQIVWRTDSALDIWRANNAPDSANMTTLTTQLAAHAYDVISQWPQPGDLTLPPMPVNDLNCYYYTPVGLRLRWSPVMANEVGLPITCDGYSIWRMDYFGDVADSIGYTTQLQYIVPDGIAGERAFFQIKAHLNVP